MSLNFVYLHVPLLLILMASLLIIGWMRKRSFPQKFNKNYYAIPLIIIMLISGLFVQETAWKLNKVRQQYTERRDLVLENKWEEVVRQLTILQNENFLLVEEISQNIIKDLGDYEPKELDLMFAELSNRDNIIRQVTDENIKEVYFRGIVSEMNDPFVLLIGKGEEDSYILSNHSQSCAVYGPTPLGMEREYRFFEDVMGDSNLARHSLGSIVSLKVGLPYQEYLFLQVEKRKQGPVKHNTLVELKQEFMETRGDIYDLFEGVEFLAPYYIYRDESISGAPRLVNRVKTEAKILGVVSSFGYLNIVQHDYDFIRILNSYDDILKSVRDNYITEERMTLFMGLLMLAFSYLLLIIFWLFMHLNVEEASKKKSF